MKGGEAGLEDPHPVHPSPPQPTPNSLAGRRTAAAGRAAPRITTRSSQAGVSKEPRGSAELRGRRAGGSAGRRGGGGGGLGWGCRGGGGHLAVRVLPAKVNWRCRYRACVWYSKLCPSSRKRSPSARPWGAKRGGWGGKNRVRGAKEGFAVGKMG